MKLDDIYKISPEIFVLLPMQQQQHMLAAVGLDVDLDLPLTGFSVHEEVEYEDIYFFSGTYSKIETYRVKYIKYWNAHYSLQLAI